MPKSPHHQGVLRIIQRDRSHFSTNRLWYLGNINRKLQLVLHVQYVHFRVSSACKHVFSHYSNAIKTSAVKFRRRKCCTCSIPFVKVSIYASCETIFPVELTIRNSLVKLVEVSELTSKCFLLVIDSIVLEVFVTSRDEVSIVFKNHIVDV